MENTFLNHSLISEIINTNQKTKSMKKVFAAVVLFLFATASYAQDGYTHSYFGLKAGANFSTNKYDPDVPCL